MLTEEKIQALLRKRVERVGTAEKWAKKHNISLAVVKHNMAGHHAPSPAILEIMGIEAYTAYRYKTRRPRAKKLEQGEFGTIYGEFDE